MQKRRRLAPLGQAVYLHERASSVLQLLHDHALKLLRTPLPAVHRSSRRTTPVTRNGSVWSWRCTWIVREYERPVLRVLGQKPVLRIQAPMYKIRLGPVSPTHKGTGPTRASTRKSIADGKGGRSYAWIYLTESRPLVVVALFCHWSFIQWFINLRILKSSDLWILQFSNFEILNMLNFQISISTKFQLSQYLNFHCLQILGFLNIQISKYPNYKLSNLYKLPNLQIF